MRRLLVLALVGCGTETPVDGRAQVVLDIPNGVLDPQGYTSVQITMHEAGGDTVRSAAIGPDGAFDLGDLDPRAAISIEAVLRDDRGAPVGYGRTAAELDLAAGAAITVQVRRPIAYIAGASYTGSFNQPPVSWFVQPATFSDLTSGVALDGTTTAAERPALVISAGPQLYTIDQAVDVPTGNLIGPATIRAVSPADHSMGPPLGELAAGGVQDGAGSDDGGLLVVGTSQRLYAVDARPGAVTPVRELAMGSFARVAIVAGAGGGLGAVAIRNRVATTGACNPTAELWWITGLGDEVAAAQMVATGGFADVAADRGRAWYVDACKGELGEALPTGVRAVRADLGKPTAIAVSNGQAWIGIERAAPTTLSIAVTQVEAATGMRTLWSEPQEQILGAVDYPGVERRLSAQTAAFLALEVGAGGDYVAAATSGTFYGPPVPSANFPEMDIETRELRVFAADSGGSVQRYRSWCDGSYSTFSSDIQRWRCATQTGQTAPATTARRQRLASMAFLFGKK